jgi:hypothetical protein
MTTYSQVSGVVTARVGDDLVLLNPATEIFFSLNETAERIWELLASPMTEEALVRALRQEYEVDESHCRDAVSAFLREAQTHGVIQTS